MNKLLIFLILPVCCIFLTHCIEEQKAPAIKEYPWKEGEKAIAMKLDTAVKDLGINVCDLRVETLKAIYSHFQQEGYITDPIDFRKPAELIEALAKYYHNTGNYAEASCTFYHGALALTYLGFQDYRKARSFLKNAEYIPYENLPDTLRSPLKSQIYNLYLQAYSEEGIISQAKIYQKEFVKLIEEKDTSLTNLSMGTILMNVGLSIYINSKFKDVDTAEKLMIESIPYFRKELTLNKDSLVAIAYGNLGIIFEEGPNSDPDKSLSYHKKAEEIYNTIFPSPESAPSNYSNLYFNMANAYRLQGDFDKALEFNQKSYDLDTKGLSPQQVIQNPNIMETFFRFGLIYEGRKDFRNAILSYQKAISTMTSGKFDVNDIYANPDSGSVILVFGNQASTVLLQKAKTLAKLSDNVPEILDAYSYGLSFLERLKEVYPYSSFQYDLADSAYQYYDQYFNLVYNTFGENACQGTPRQVPQDINPCEIIQETFLISEQNKTGFLSQETYQNSRDYLKTRNLLGIPDSISDREEELFLKLRHLDAAYNVNSGMGAPEELLAPYANQLTETYKEIEKLQEYLTETYPVYARARFPQKVGDIGSIQAELAEDQTLISYFVGQKNVYAWALDREELVFKNLGSAGEITGLIEEYGHAVQILNKYYMSSEGDINSSADTLYHSVGKLLFDKLMAPFADQLKRRIIIVPDKEISSIAFSGLPVKDLVIDSQHYNQGENYVNDTYAIAYAPSASTWRDLQKVEVQKGPFYMFIADRGAKRQGDKEFDELKYGKGLLDELQEKMKVKGFDGNEARLGFVKQRMPEAGILYFYAHGYSENNSSQNSYLVLSDSNMNLSDVYPLRLKADLSILNACELGEGTFIPGQGVQSFNNGMIQAGSRSVVASLWNLDEKISKSINKNFLYLLKEDENLPRDLALQRAKQLYSRKNFSHPVFWSCEVLNGSTDPVKL